jgi:hypothetical protein
MKAALGREGECERIPWSVFDALRQLAGGWSQSPSWAVDLIRQVLIGYCVAVEHVEFDTNKYFAMWSKYLISRGGNAKFSHGITMRAQQWLGGLRLLQVHAFHLVTYFIPATNQTVRRRAVAIWWTWWWSHVLCDWIYLIMVWTLVPWPLF